MSSPERMITAVFLVAAGLVVAVCVAVLGALVWAVAWAFTAGARP